MMDIKPVGQSDWINVKNLGNGSFGMITLWQNKSTKAMMAIKSCLRKSSELKTKQCSYWNDEVEMMKRIDHPNIVQFVAVPSEIAAGFKNYTDLPLMGMEYCDGGDLRKVLQKSEHACGLREREVRRVLRHVSSALDYLHSKRIVHRDVKPENIILKHNADGSITYKVIDLGYGKDFGEAMSIATSFVGTLHYLAPELFNGKQYNYAVDYWSFGVLATEVTSGKRPFFHNGSPVEWFQELKKKQSCHIGGNYNSRRQVEFVTTLPTNIFISPTLKRDLEKFLTVALEYDAAKRVAPPPYSSPFEMLKDFLDRSVSHVFDVAACRLYTFAVTSPSSINMQEFQGEIQGVLNIVPEKQIIVVPKPTPKILDESVVRDLKNIVMDDYRPTVFVFGGQRPVVAPQKVYPTAVERVLTPGNGQNKKYWSEALCQMEKDCSRLTYLVEAFEVLVEYIYSRCDNDLRKLNTSVVNRFNEIKCRSDVLTECMSRDQPNVARLLPKAMDFYRNIGQFLEQASEKRKNSKLLSQRLERLFREIGELRDHKRDAFLKHVLDVRNSLFEQYGFIRKNQLTTTDNFRTFYEEFARVTDLAHDRIGLAMRLYMQIDDLSRQLEDTTRGLEALRVDVQRRQASRDNMLWNAMEVALRNQRQSTAETPPVVSDASGDAEMPSFYESTIDDIRTQVSLLDNEFTSLMSDIHDPNPIPK